MFSQVSTEEDRVSLVPCPFWGEVRIPYPTSPGYPTSSHILQPLDTLHPLPIPSASWKGHGTRDTLPQPVPCPGTTKVGGTQPTGMLSY